ncbi:AAA family ATPase [Vibrio cholerae]|uniref:AAA family ATPase n=1 Tax=Vibrio cholerae TaxID=666 RepID=UPI001C308A84|nr:ATP-binding protein [Vibrio cholerae]
MIVDFTVKNFRSIRSEQLFSMYADKKPKHHAGSISYLEDSLGILKTAAIYGSNASGKSNLIMAFEALRSLVVESGDWKDGDTIDCYQPYLLSNETSTQPTEFELEFYVKNIRYRYHVCFNGTSILYEKLDQYLTARPTNLFLRSNPDDWKSVKFGDAYKGGKKQIAFFKNNTYLSKAGNTPDSPELTRDIYNYFRRQTETLLATQSLNIIDWDLNEHTKEAVNYFLRKADFGINKFEFEKREIPKNLSFPDNMPDDIRNAFLSDLSKRECFYHESETGELIRFTSDMESRGTNRLFKMLPAFIEALKDGSVLFIDEIESSFHPHIAELIIKIFNDPVVNTKNAQLIYTTHDLSLMSSALLRKDQIYLTEKSIENGSEYTCLENFDSNLKDNSPFSKWYDEGKLGGIPKINYFEITSKIREVIDNA